MNDLTLLLLAAPDSHLDTSIKPLIEKWDEKPTAIQILEVLDQIVHCGLASELVIKVLNSQWKMAIADEHTTMEAIIAQAHWRNK